MSIASPARVRQLFRTSTGYEVPARRLKMVEWYSPKQLITTAAQVVISTIFGEHADRRLLESLGIKEPQIYSYKQNEITIDYIADTGDGWDSTYTVAYWASRSQLEFSNPADGRSVTTTRGNILIFGGDEVYPVASRTAYKERLEGPFRSAMPYSEPPHPHVYAIPGNHDWYDSLSQFVKLFVDKEWFGGWQSPQTHSYFVLELPHHWWLVGTDVALSSDIDKAQLDYFKRAAELMGPADRVILCNAEPHWVTDKEFGRKDVNLKHLEEKVFKNRIAVHIAGDIHHYRRHESADGRHKITAGGGGAFLHPTHGYSAEPLDGFALKASFPDHKTSARLTNRNLLFPFKNWKFGLAPAIAYMLTAWSVHADVTQIPLAIGNVPAALRTVANQAFNSQTAGIWILLLFAGFFLFTDTSSKWYRWVGGFIHASSHLLACLFVGWFASRGSYLILANAGFQAGFGSVAHNLASAILIFAGGWAAGSILMGLYLWVSLKFFRRHRNEAFSSLAIPDWKNFLRLKVDTNGDLTIYSIGIERVIRDWKFTGWNDDTGTQVEPANVQTENKPQLIEEPIVVPAGAQSPAVVVSRPGKMLNETIIPFRAGDGFQCNLIRIRGEQEPRRGPVILVHGAGVRGNIFRAPVERTIVDALVDEGYDVFIENWRASIEFPPSHWTLDEAAVFDHPQAIQTIVRETGADRVKAIIHCQGSTSFTMSAMAGLLPQVNVVVTNAVSLHPLVPWFSAFKLKFAVPMLKTITGYLSPRWGVEAPTWQAKMIRTMVRLTHHECNNDVCKMVSFVYGAGFPALWRHENLDDATHEWLKREFAECPLTFFSQMARCVQKGNLVSLGRKELPADFAAQPPQTDARFVFLTGALNRCFLPESQVRSFEFFERQRKNYHSLHVVPKYGHLDIFMGKNALTDTFPLIVEELNRKH